MSLIDEALKRARMEAAQRAAEQEGLPYPAIPRHRAPRRRPVWLAAAVLVLALVGGIALGRWLASGGPPSEDPPLVAGAVAAPATTAPAPAAPEVDDAAASRPAPPPARPIEPAPAAPEAQRGPATSRRQPSEPPRAAPPATVPAETPRPGPQPSANRPAAAQPPQPAAAPTAVTDSRSGVLLVLPDPAVVEPAVAEVTAPAPDESHVASYSIPGGGAIALDGIAWSETGPFALINGRVVGPGSEVESFTLERIGPGHVVLQGDGRRIRIDLQ